MLEDVELIQRVARNRDPEAFSSLYDRHAPRVFGLACRMLARREEAEDLMQEIFLSLWEKAAAYDPAKGPVVAWILVIARSRCLDRLRRRKLREGKEQTIFSQEEEGDRLIALPEPCLPVLEGLAGAERDAEVRRALESLPLPQRSAVEAAAFEGLTQQEIADKTGDPLGTVKTRMRLGMLKLAELLSAREKIR
ncbi:MAG: sigma-70 family RNA polymerase sigma factor [Elusimicrobia bacterium]|nr:sigma-70 family RNA polymerase sigma factor [Elusimicrobiota bacterium]